MLRCNVLLKKLEQSNKILDIIYINDIFYQWYIQNTFLRSTGVGSINYLNLTFGYPRYHLRKMNASKDDLAVTFDDLEYVSRIERKPRISEFIKNVILVISGLTGA